MIVHNNSSSQEYEVTEEETHLKSIEQTTQRMNKTNEMSEL